MSWQTGTSDNYKDLLADLRTLAVTTTTFWDEGVAVDGGRYTTGTEDEWIATGDGSGGSDAITCGIRTYSDEQLQIFNWELAGMDQYTDANTFTNQPGISDGRHDGAGNARYGMYMPLCDRSMKYWFSVTASRMVVVARVGSFYATGYLGWADRHDTVGNYAQPKVVAGTMVWPDFRYTDVHVGISGVINPIGRAAAGQNGPMQIHNRAGTWDNVKNRTYGDTSTVVSSVDRTRVCHPLGQIDNSGGPGTADAWVSNATVGTGGSFMMGVIIPESTSSTDFPGNQRAILRRTPDPGASEDTIKRLECVIQEKEESDATLDGVFWASAGGGPNDPPVQPEDVIDFGGTNYHMFPMGWNGADWNYICVEEK